MAIDIVSNLGNPNQLTHAPVEKCPTTFLSALGFPGCLPGPPWMQ